MDRVETPTDARRWLIYWDGGKMRVKGDELREGEFTAGIEVVPKSALTGAVELLRRVGVDSQAWEEINAFLAAQSDGRAFVITTGRGGMTPTENVGGVGGPITFTSGRGEKP